MKITMECKRISAEEAGSSRPRLILADHVWSDWGDMEFCAHGEKLRWSCDACDEYFAKHPDEA